MIATYQRTIFEKGDFSICAFKPENEQEPPQSAVSKYGTFVGTGFNLPHSEDISLNLDGTWESSKFFRQAFCRTSRKRWPSEYIKPLEMMYFRCLKTSLKNF